MALYQVPFDDRLFDLNGFLDQIVELYAKGQSQPTEEILDSKKRDIAVQFIDRLEQNLNEYLAPNEVSLCFACLLLVDKNDTFLMQRRDRVQLAINKSMRQLAGELAASSQPVVAKAPTQIPPTFAHVKKPPPIVTLAMAASSSNIVALALSFALMIYGFATHRFIVASFSTIWFIFVFATALSRASFALAPLLLVWAYMLWPGMWSGPCITVALVGAGLWWICIGKEPA